MESSFFHRLSGILWGVIVTLIVLLAIYVSVGRMLASNIGAWQDDILRELNHRVPFTVEAQKVSGEWQAFTPVIILTGLRLSVEDSARAPLELSEGRVGVDVMRSLLTRSLQMTRLALDDLSLLAELTEEGRFRIRGFDGGGDVGQWIREFLLNVELVALRNNRLTLTLPGGEVRDLEFNALLTRERSHRRLEANLISTRGTDISLLAEGVGDPFTPELFSGEVYVQVQSTDLGAIKDMLPRRAPDLWADGALDLELWLTWDKGKPSIASRLEARDLLIAPLDLQWQVPLDRVALEWRLVERRNHWTVFASNIDVERDDVSLQLSRLQLDTWGDALRLRATQIPLAPLNAIATGLQATPAALASVFNILQPRGELAMLQVSIGDIAEPLADWEVEANFEDVAVESWKGAPGVTAARGYAQLAPGGGFVVLDSQQLTLELPTIYEEPLHYDEFHGTIHIEWDALDLNLSSGLVTTMGEEGRARVLFGLNVPLVKNPIGLEMDLLVGLEKSHPIHRAKYVPFILNEALNQWLSSSIGDGSIEEGAFLWRGTVKPDTAPLHTVQLAFNIADTGLTYHPQWPPVTVLDGTILIDDSDVSVWAEEATLFDSRVRHLSVETWLNDSRQIMLAVDGSVRGPAADGLTVLNDSPLASIVGRAFADWQLTGELDTDLDLQLNLTDKAVRPRVDVATRWHDVDLDINPGNLPVRDLNGEFNYSTTSGLSSDNLVAQLWGNPLQVKLEQRHRSRRKGYDPASSVVEVAIATKAEMADVRRWLNLDSLAFVQGQSPVDIKVVVAPGSPPVLNIDSALKGVSLDLPAPWRKQQAARMPLHLEMPLASGANVLSLQLGEQLKLELDMADGALRAAALAIAAEPAPLEAGVLHVSGHAPLLQVEEWSQFVRQYFTGQMVAQGAGKAIDGAAVAQREQQEDTNNNLSVMIDQLRADKLVLWGQELQDVTFSLAMEPNLWRLSFEMDWLRGDAVLAQDGTVSTLDIGHLDLSGLAQLNLVSGDGQQVLELPDVDITLDQIYQADRYLGKLAFELRSRGDLLSAQSITGELANMSLPAQRPGRLTWRQGADSQSALQASLQFEDLGRTLEYFGYQRILETRSGRFDLDLRWPGAPQGFSLREGLGSMQVDIGSGSFLEAPSGATGALRVVSILNLADIVKRLSLTHMFESGIPFDSVNGEIFLHKGTIEVAQMRVEGGSSFQFSGLSKVATQSLDGELIATLPVANNLPWVAALAASLPIAAGVFVVSKVFNKQMNRLSSAVYSIGGSWNDPEVKFDHIFDASTAKEKSSVVMPMVEALLGEQVAPAPDPQSPGQPASP